MLLCSTLKSEISSSELVNRKVVYEEIFADAKKQKVIVDLFSKLIEARLKVLNDTKINHQGMIWTRTWAATFFKLK